MVRTIHTREENKQRQTICWLEANAAENPSRQSPRLLPTMPPQGLPTYKEVLLIHTKCIRGSNVTCLSQGNLRYVTSSQTLRTSDTFMLCPSTRAQDGSHPIRQMFWLKTGIGRIPHPQVILNGWEAF